MKVLLLAGDQTKQGAEPQCLKPFGEHTLLDFQIQSLLHLKFEPVVVLDGPMADEVLRKSAHVREVDLVFDTQDNPTFLSNLRAGLHDPHQECFALPVEVPCPDLEIWQKIRLAFHRRAVDNPEVHLLRPYTPIWGTLVPGFPLMFTQAGKKFFIENPQLGSLEEAHFVPVPILDRSITRLVKWDRDLRNPQETL